MRSRGTLLIAALSLTLIAAVFFYWRFSVNPKQPYLSVSGDSGSENTNQLTPSNDSSSLPVANNSPTQNDSSPGSQVSEVSSLERGNISLAYDADVETTLRRLADPISMGNLVASCIAAKADGVCREYREAIKEDGKLGIYNRARSPDEIDLIDQALFGMQFQSVSEFCKGYEPINHPVATQAIKNLVDSKFAPTMMDLYFSDQVKFEDKSQRLELLYSRALDGDPRAAYAFMLSFNHVPKLNDQQNFRLSVVQVVLGKTALIDHPEQMDEFLAHRGRALSNAEIDKRNELVSKIVSSNVSNFRDGPLSTLQLVKLQVQDLRSCDESSQ